MCRPEPGYVRPFNVGTVLTLALAGAVSYVVLFAGTVLAAALLIDTSVLEQTLKRPVAFTYYLTLAWIISSLATSAARSAPGWRTRRPCGPPLTATIRHPAAGGTRGTGSPPRVFHPWGPWPDAVRRPMAPQVRLVARQGLRTTFSQLSCLCLKMSYPCGASCSGSRCVITRVGSISPRSIRCRSGSM
jgi:hypothetical protein